MIKIQESWKEILLYIINSSTFSVNNLNKYSLSTWCGHITEGIKLSLSPATQQWTYRYIWENKVGTTLVTKMLSILPKVMEISFVIISFCSSLLLSYFYFLNSMFDWILSCISQPWMSLIHILIACRPKKYFRDYLVLL